MLTPQAKTVFLEKLLNLKLKFVACEGSTMETGSSSVMFEFPMTASRLISGASLKRVTVLQGTR